MAIKQWNVGDVLTASDMNLWTVPLVGIKSANQTTQNSTLINDADMRLPVASNAVYEFNALIRYSSGTGQDFKFSMTVPSGADCRYQALMNDLQGNFGGVGDFSAASNVPSKGVGVGTIQTATLKGALFTASAAGNLIFQWAQNTTGAFNTVLYQYSYLVAHRIG